jgi:hypothetical protein
MKYVRYKSIGNSVGLEEDIDDYWEIDPDGNVTRSICSQADGTQLKYDPSHDADSFGQLPEGIISEEHLQDASYGKISPLSLEEFELKWRQKAKNRT